MEVTSLVPDGVQVIHGYGDGRFRIAETVHEGAVLVMPESTVPWSVEDPAALAALDPDTLTPVLEAEQPFDILLVGCGARQVFISAESRASVRARGPVVEMMDTGAACRTFNLLLAEGRRVAAALLPVG